MAVHAVLFDLDDTLLIDEAVSRECFLSVGDLAQRRASVDSVQFVQDAEHQALERHRNGPCYELCHGIGISAFECLWGDFVNEGEQWTPLAEWVPRFRRDVWAAALAEQDVDNPELAAELAETWKRERRERQTLMPNAREVVEKLGATYKLGMLTNGAPDLQASKIEGTGLKDHFQAIAISGAVGVGKPQPGVFEWLLQEMGSSVEDTVMVGNSLERDIAGARNVGMRSVYIVSADTETNTEHKPDHVIHDLAELPGLLEEM